MKKMLKAMTAAVAVAAVMTASAAAADFDHCADSLKELGLFQGGTSGYELDRAPTRAEAATMLVRLLGKEAEAKELTYSAPFTDLEGWEQPYVQYLYDNKLTTGSTATTFDPLAKCDAQMYTIFLLRALGYSDASGDFTYDKSLDKGKEIGLVDAVNCNETNFLRDNVVAMSYTALAVNPKDVTDSTLLDKLVADGAVEAAKAEPMQKLLTNLKDYAALNEKASKENKTSMKMDFDVDVKANSASVMTMKMTMDVAADMNLTDLNKSQMAMTGKMDLTLDPSLAKEGEESKLSEDIKYYYTDGNYYMTMADQKLKMPMDFSSMQGMMTDMQQIEPLSLIKSLEIKTENGSKVYTMTYAGGGMNSLIKSVMDSMQLGNAGSIKMGDVTATMTVKDDLMTAMDMTMAMSMTIEGQTMDMSMTMKASDMKYGDTVKVTLPTDLDTYTAAA